MNDLSTKAMLASLSISVWQARKYDKRVSKEVAAQYGTSEDAGRYNKKLLPADAPSYKAAISAAGEARTAHYEATLAWADDGARILPSANYFTYRDKMKTLQANFYQKVQEFVAEYPALRAQAQISLNGLYKGEDYPEDIAAKFSFGFKFLPISTSNDFRVSLTEEDEKTIREQIEADTGAAIGNAMQDLWQRLYDAVAHVNERLSDPDLIFRDTLIGNLRDICSAIPKLNLTADPQLEAFRAKVEARLAQYDPDVIRHSAGPLRKSIAEQAAEIQRQMAGMMGGR